MVAACVLSSSPLLRSMKRCFLTSVRMRVDVGPEPRGREQKGAELIFELIFSSWVLVERIETVRKPQ